MKHILDMLTKTILQTTRHVPRLAGLALLALTPAAWAETVLFTNVGTFDWVVPANVSLVTVECWGGGGAAGSAKSIATGSTQARAGGGGGGSFARIANLAVTAGQTNRVIVGAGGLSYTNDIALVGHNYVDPTQTGGDSVFTSFDFLTTHVLANGGGGGGNALKTTAAHTPATGGSGALGNWVGDIAYPGGNGGSPNTSSTGHSGGGGGGAGDANPGGNGSVANLTAGGIGGVAGGGNGGNGRGAAGPPQVLPTTFGGGGGGVVATTSNMVNFGAAGAPGGVRLTYAIDLGVDHYAVVAGSPQTAGVPFNVTITAQDINNDTVPDSINTVTVTSPGDNLMEFDWNSDGTYGDNSGTLVAGVKTIRARDKRAETVSIEATGGAVITTLPPYVTIDPAAFAKLQILLPNETAAPGTTNGKTGTIIAQTYGVEFYVTVNSVDEFWNLVPSVGDTVAITAPNDPAAVIPDPAPLLSGQGTINLTLNTIGTNTLTATDVTDGTKTASTTVVTVLGVPFVWQGDGAANLWTTSPSVLNWTNALGTPVAFIPGVFAVFNDTSANPVVDIVGTVTPGSITVNLSSNYILGSTSGGSIGGVAKLTTLGSGTLKLATSNSYSGGILISAVGSDAASTVWATASQALGSGTVTIGSPTLSSPARLDVSGGINVNNSISLHAKNLAEGLFPGIRSISGNNSLSGAITLILGGTYYIIESEAGLLTLGTNSATGITYPNAGSRLLYLQGAGDGLVAGNISGSANPTAQIIKDGAGTWTLSGAGNNYGGDTTITAGTLKLGTNNVIPNGSGKGYVTNNGTLHLNGFTETINGLFGSGIVEGGVGPNTFTVGTAGDRDTNFTFDGVIQNTSGTLALVKAGTNIFTLTSAHTFNGTVTVANGTLALTNSASFNNVTSLAVATSATLDVSGLTSGALTLGANQTLQRSGSPVGPINVTGNLTMGSGKLLLALNTTNLPHTNDSLVVSATFTPGGTLTVTNIGPALAVGDSFRLFPAGVSGFSVVNLPTNDPAKNIVSYTWNDTLSTDGKITVATVTPGVNPLAPNLQVSVSGSTLSLGWPTNAGWTLLTNSASLSASNQWFPYPNSATLTNVDIPIDPAKTNVFFKMQYPYP